MYIIYFGSTHPSYYLLIMPSEPLSFPNEFFVLLSRLFYDPLSLIKVSHTSMDIGLFIEA